MLRFSDLRGQWNKESYRELLVCFLSAVAINFVVELLARRSLFDTLAFSIGKPWVFFYGVLLIFFTLSFSLLFRKQRFYFFLISTVWLGLAITDFVMLTFRSMPFTASDIWIMSSVRDIFEKYLDHLQIFFLILGISLLIGLILLLWNYAKKFPQKFFFSLAHTLFTGLVLALMTVLFLHIDILDSSAEFSNLPQAYQDNGFAYSFSASLVTGGIHKPVAYSPNEVEQILDTERELPPTASDTPNIIFVQLESFFDVNYLQDLTFSENPVPNFQALKESCSCGLLSVPSIGAGTANTEFEILTGMNLNHFGVGEYPYMTVVNSEAVESLPFALSDIGYGTHAIHNNNATFYDRHLVYANLGFQSFTSLEYMNNVTTNPRGWAKDDVLTDEIWKALLSTEGKDLVFTVSVQPHGKYPTLPLDGAPTIAVNGMEDEERKNGMEYYLAQLKECDAFVGELTRSLAQFDEPTVVVFYGDHLPSFRIQQKELGYGDTQTTEYVIWANFDMKREVRDLQTYQLSAYVLNLCKIHEGTLFRLHQSYDFDSEQNAAYQDDLKVLEYDILYGEQYYAGENTLPNPTQMRFDVEDTVITAVQIDTENESMTVSGEHFTPYSVVYINDVAYPTEFLSEKQLKVTDVDESEDTVIYVAQVSAADQLEVLSRSDVFILRQ